MKPAVVYHEGFLRYDFGPEHALREVRVQLARDLIAAYGLLDSLADEIRPDPPSESVLLAVHSAEYVAKVKELSANPTRSSEKDGLGTPDNPVFAGMFEASLLQVGATMRACKDVASGHRPRAFNLGGGFHHAMRNMASGFCIFNDIAVGISALLEERLVTRVLYVDLDAHHGDGVQSLYYADPRVMTISLHEDGHHLFPGTGFPDEIGEGAGKGYAVNVPLPPYTRDASYLYAFKEIVPPLARAFRPDLIVSQLGADAHYLDPLTHLLLTSQTYEAVGHILDELSRELCHGRWVAVGGGGYDVTAVPRIWTLLGSTMFGRRLDDALPAEWMRDCARLINAVPAGGLLRDRVTEAEEPHVPRQVKRTIAEVQRAVFPLHEIR